MGADSPELLNLENLFKGELESSLHCSKCPYTSSRSEEFTYALCCEHGHGIRPQTDEAYA